jgi:hypothetical protein
LAKEAAKFTAVVVLPTPPFWLDMQIVLVIGVPSLFVTIETIQGLISLQDLLFHVEQIGYNLYFGLASSDKMFHVEHFSKEWRQHKSALTVQDGLAMARPLLAIPHKEFSLCFRKDR